MRSRRHTLSAFVRRRGELRRRARGQGARGPPGTRWHFLGTIQRNKVKSLAPHVHLWQGLARRSEGERIARFSPGTRACSSRSTRATGYPAATGVCRPKSAGLASSLADLDLVLEGLMTVAPPEDRRPPEPAFQSVRPPGRPLGLEERSMGMSDDLEAAVAAGSTMVGVGRALFGERPARAPPSCPSHS